MLRRGFFIPRRLHGEEATFQFQVEEQQSEDIRVQGEARGQRSGSQRQAGPQQVQQWLPPALQKLCIQLAEGRARPTEQTQL